MSTSEMNRCPVCGKTTLQEYDICDICGWENDPIQLLNEESRGANGITIQQAREAYRNGETFFE